MPNETRQRRLCTIKGCDSPAHARGWCSRHYGCWRNNGDPLVSPRGSYNLNPPDTCTVAGCNEPHCAKGMCKSHWAKQAWVKDRLRENHDRWRRDTAKGRLQTLAGNTVRRMVFKGLLKRGPCEVCGSEPAHGHHDSYRREDWLKVRWLCQKHHAEWHKHNEPIYPSRTVVSFLKTAEASPPA